VDQLVPAENYFLGKTIQASLRTGKKRNGLCSALELDIAEYLKNSTERMNYPFDRHPVRH
jgi:hypothetical protein